MRDRIVIKWGGGLITDKSLMCTPNLEVLNDLASTVAACVESGFEVILVHGAGSFGHLRSKKWRLNEGYIEGMKRPDNSDCTSQLDAVHRVRSEMLELNQHVCEALESCQLIPHVHPPHTWVTNTGPDFSGTLEGFESNSTHTVHVTFGDVVSVEGEKQFGILSGDDLVVRLAVELPRVQRLVFAIGGVDGLLRVPPKEATDEDLIERWSPDVAFEGIHESDIDVTGGIGLKASRGVLVASHGVDVIMVNGGVRERVMAAMLGEPVRGTIITEKQ